MLASSGAVLLSSFVTPRNPTPATGWPPPGTHEPTPTWVVLLEYNPKGVLNAKVQDENLMPGDAANPPPQPST